MRLTGFAVGGAGGDSSTGVGRSRPALRRGTRARAPHRWCPRGRGAPAVPLGRPPAASGGARGSKGRAQPPRVRRRRRARSPGSRGSPPAAGRGRRYLGRTGASAWYWPGWFRSWGGSPGRWLFVWPRRRSPRGPDARSGGRPSPPSASMPAYTRSPTSAFAARSGCAAPRRMVPRATWPHSL